jgi:hypothetical protein
MRKFLLYTTAIILSIAFIGNVAITFSAIWHGHYGIAIVGGIYAFVSLVGWAAVLSAPD